MRRHIPLGVMAALGTVLLACGPQPRQDQRAIEEAAERAGGEVIVGGCLTEGAETGAFVLANAQLAYEPAGALLDEPPPPLPTGEGPITGTIPIVTRSPDYVLEPPAAVDLRPHVGRQVQVTGVLDLPADEDPPVVDREGADGLIRAENVRLIAERCIGA